MMMMMVVVVVIMRVIVVGCANPVPPGGATVVRNGDVLTVRCNVTGETWYLTCSKSRWIGSVGNCSTHSSTSDSFFAFV